MSLGIVWASINHFAIYLVSLKREETNLVFFWFKKRCNMTRISIMKKRIWYLGLRVEDGEKGGTKEHIKISTKNTHTEPWPVFPVVRASSPQTEGFFI